jgi:hypothetical protein
MQLKKRFFIVGVFVFGMVLTGCEAPVPKDVLKPNVSVLQNRSLQSRSFDTLNEKLLLSASAGALQDIGFTIDDSETKLGLIVASKDADATNKTQLALATTGIVLGVLAGSVDTRTYQNLDDVQKIRASLVTHQNPGQKKTMVRVTFQRVVWNKNKQISKRETLNDPKLYQGFYDRLSKAVFLEGHQI